mmetsp:Transcript_37792/g.84433  ORF Transcript_37792/g.84433 Transcript_37792/m.84433 type:complete len:203 (+) Transcript_37792:184-792(+)
MRRILALNRFFESPAQRMSPSITSGTKGCRAAGSQRPMLILTKLTTALTTSRACSLRRTRTVLRSWGIISQRAGSSGPSTKRIRARASTAAERMCGVCAARAAETTWTRALESPMACAMASRRSYAASRALALASLVHKMTSPAMPGSAAMWFSSLESKTFTNRSRHLRRICRLLTWQVRRDPVRSESSSASRAFSSSSWGK